jgi:hypothetical protein
LLAAKKRQESNEENAGANWRSTAEQSKNNNRQIGKETTKNKKQKVGEPMKEKN